MVLSKILTYMHLEHVYADTSGGSRTQNLWGQLVEAEGPSHICYSKIPLVLSKHVGPDGPTDYTWIRHCDTISDLL
jgi:hypothetical protein